MKATYKSGGSITLPTKCQLYVTGNITKTKELVGTYNVEDSVSATTKNMMEVANSSKIEE